MTKEEKLIINDELEEISGGTNHKIDGKTPIGKLIVLKENIYFRYEPDKYSSDWGTAQTGITYSVYEIKQNNGLKWYLVDNHSWFGDDGTNCIFTFGAK